MAYAALVSLSQTLDRILAYEPYLLLFEKETLVSLHKNVDALLTFVEEYWDKCRGTVNPLESRIITAAYQAEDLLEYHIDEVINPIHMDEVMLNSTKGWLEKLIESFCISICKQEPRRRLELEEPRRMPEVIEPDIYEYHIGSISEDELEIKNNNLKENVLLLGLSTKINTVVLDDDFRLIKKRMYNKSCNFEVIPIVGMVGIGKTTLAQTLYEDSIKQGYFDIYIWVISQDYPSDEIVFKEVFHSVGKGIDKYRVYSDGAYLEQGIYQHLFGQRYLLVVDNLWSEKTWNDLNVVLPKETAGSRVLVTTRKSTIAHYVDSSSNQPYQIQLLNKFQKWTLFEERVFGEGSSCPSELEQIGKNVADSCQGHHLTTVVIARLLKKNVTKEYWESISEDISSLEPLLEQHCLKLLLLSYNHLPLHLKLCFLYVTTFLGDKEIKASKLIRLWMAEGFVKPSESMPSEEVAEGYLHDLVGRSLLIVSEKVRYNNIIKTITIHDIVKDFGTLTAQQEKFLDKHSHMNPLEGQMSDTLYHAEGIIENQFYLPEPKRIFASLQKVLLDIDLILEEATKVINNNPAENVWLLESFSMDTTNDINNMALEDDFILIINRIYNESSNLQIIPIVGMGGIGKSTLARRLYEDSIDRRHFDRCIWIVISQYYSPRKLFVDIMISIGMPIIDKHTGKECNDGELIKRIYQELYGRRYMIVVDDLWSVEAWDDLNLILPKDATGSRVLVTTRLFDIASYVGSSSNPPYEKQLLNEYHSWMLFEERVFGKGFSCPFELEQIGREVVKGCRGLPLTIVVVAGLLKGPTTKEYWESISKNISPSEPTIELHCSKVLSLSYNHLPLHLRPCFLYVTSFPEDYEIRANRLIRLWMAEGFVKPNGSKCLEDVAERYLHDLVGRSLLMVSKKVMCNERIKTVRVHDLLRIFGISTAQQERFHYHGDLNPEYRRITPRDSVSLLLLLKCYKPATRSIQMPYSLLEYGEHSFENLRLLRVLDAWDTYIGMKGDASNLVHLRYLSIHYADNTLLKSISEFRNIVTLIIHVHKACVIPLKLWKNPSLRHLILPSLSRLEQPYGDGIYEETSLHTIRSVTNLRLTKKVIEMLSNIRKLKIRYEPVSCDLINLCNEYDLINLVHLQKLVKLAIDFPAISIPYISDLAFPKTLEKLSLSFIKGLWNDMSVVGSLPNLQVFKLSWSFPKGGGWEPIEGQFLKLKHLKFEHVRLDHWEAESANFPSLEILVLKNIKGELNEIPSGIGESDTLQLIKLAGCNESIVDSAKQIQADQWELSNADFQLLVSSLNLYEEEEYEVIRPEGY